MRLTIFCVLGVASCLAECITVRDSYIKVSDLAVRAPSLPAVTADTLLIRAPDPGVRRWFSPSELSKLLASAGLAAPTSAGVCVVRAARVLRADEIVFAMKKALRDDAARIDLKDFSRFTVPDGAVEFSIAGLGAGGDLRAD